MVENLNGYPTNQVYILSALIKNMHTKKSEEENLWIGDVCVVA